MKAEHPLPPPKPEKPKKSVREKIKLKKKKKKSKPTIPSSQPEHEAKKRQVRKRPILPPIPEQEEPNGDHGDVRSEINWSDDGNPPEYKLNHTRPPSYVAVE